MKKRILVFSLAFIFILGSFISLGESYSQTITAWFTDTKISLDGSQWTFASKPFVYNGNIYISLNDISRNLGLTMNMDLVNNVYELTSSGTNDLTLSALKYEVDKQQLEIDNLRFQLAQKDAELAILKDSSYDDDDDDDDDDDVLDDLEDMFEDDYDRYDDDNEDLYFDNYKLYQASDDDIIVKMYGTFDRKSDDWDDRDTSDFRDFIEDICREIDKEFNEDIEVTVYDDDNDKAAEYKWDDSENDLDVEYEY